MALVLRWAVLAGAFWVTTLIVDGIQIEPGAWNYFWVAALWFNQYRYWIASKIIYLARSFIS